MTTYVLEITEEERLWLLRHTGSPLWNKIATAPEKPDRVPLERLDKLEERAVGAITQFYQPRSDEERFWIQKGIEGMRLAIATEGEDE